MLFRTEPVLSKSNEGGDYSYDCGHLSSEFEHAPQGIINR